MRASNEALRGCRLPAQHRQRTAALASRDRRRARGASVQGALRIRWDRVGRIGLLVVLAVVAGLYVQDALSYLSTRSGAEQQEAIVHRLTRANAQLAREQKALSNPATIVQDARQLGMVKAGERSYVIMGLHAPLIVRSPRVIRARDIIALWREGERRLESAAPAERPVLERVRDEIVVELRRRLGGPFTADELVALYLEQGTDWAFRSRRGSPRTPRRLGHDDRRRRCVRPLRARVERLRGRAPHERRLIGVVGFVATGAADHDLVLLDRDLDRAMTGPVLGVDGVVLDGGVEPQAVALLAVVEGRLERRRLLAAAAAAATSPAAPLRGRSLFFLVVLVLLLGALGSRRRRARRRSARRPRPADRSRRRSRRRRPSVSTSGSSPCSRLKAWICCTVTSS